MLNVEVLLKAAEFLESQLILNSDASSSSSTSSSSDLINITQNTQNTSNTCGYSSSSSTSGYSSNESNNERSSSTSSSISSSSNGLLITSKQQNDNLIQINNSNVTNSRYLTIKPIVNNIEVRRNSYQAKRLNYVNNNNNNNNKTTYARVKTLSQSSSSSTASGGQYARLSKYQQNMSALRIEEIKRDKAIHNTLEKNRRAHLKECFESLQNELPHYKDKKVTNLSILNYTLKYVQTLTKREKENESEKQRLEKKQARLNNQYKQLIAELKNENIDYDSFLSNCPIANNNNNEEEEDETSTSTASEIHAHYDYDDDGMDNYDEDEDEDNMMSSSNKFSNTDDYDDTTSDNTGYSVNRKRKISSTSKLTKYTDESTDSISSDITVDNYNSDSTTNDNSKRTININSNYMKYDQNPKGNYYIKSTDHANQQKLTPVASLQHAQQMQQSINYKNYLLNASTTSSTQLNAFLKQNNRDILQKALSNDHKIQQIKQISTEHNHITTTIINTPTKSVDLIKQEPNDNQEHQVIMQSKYVKRARSSRPATVNQLLSSNNQIKTLNLSQTEHTSNSKPLSTSTPTTQITLINKNSNDNAHVPTILIKHQVSQNTHQTTPTTTTVTTHQQQQDAVNMFATLKSGFKSLNTTNLIKPILINANTNTNAHTQQLAQAMQILKQQKLNNFDEKN